MRVVRAFFRLGSIHRFEIWREESPFAVAAFDTQVTHFADGGFGFIGQYAGECQCRFTRLKLPVTIARNGNSPAVITIAFEGNLEKVHGTAPLRLFVDNLDATR